MIKTLFLAFIFVLTAGCRPSDEIDVAFFTPVQNNQSIIIELIQRNASSLSDDQIYPYKPREGCAIKKLEQNQLFICNDKNKIVVGGALNPGQIAHNRQLYLAFIDKIRQDLDANNIKYEFSIKKEIPKVEFLEFSIYRQ